MATTAAQRRPTVWDLELAAVAAVAALIVATRAYNYLLFHTLAELFSVVVGLTAFSIAWNTRRTLDTPFLLVVGLTFGPVAIVDLLHTLAFKGMGVFTGFDANLPTQLWIAGRILEVGGLTAASLWSRRRPAAGRVLAAGVAGLVLLLGAIFWLKIFPDCWREGQGLTPFKIAAEYLFMAVLALALGRLLLRRRRFHPDLFPYIVTSVVLVIVEEACFTLYSDVYGVFNMAGHIAKIAVYYMVYAGLVRFGFAVPQETLYRQLSELNARLTDDALRSNERAALAVAASDGAAWEWDMRSPAVVLTPRHGAWLGRTEPPTLDQVAGHLSPTDRRALEWAVSVRAPGEARTADFRIDVAGHPPRWIRMRTRVLVPQGAAAAVMSGFDVEITAAKTAELERERLHFALERSHAELQRFAEILAHHLREPVQRQLRYVQLFRRALPEQVPPAANEALDYILEGGQRLSELLRDVQIYLAIDTIPPPSEPISATTAFDEACRRLAARIGATGAVVERTLLPKVRIGEERLIDLFTILLDNAIAYRAPGRTPQILVSGASDPSGVVIRIADNGIGIEAPYLERIFGVFERLHTEAAHPGTGIGLAVARKIVEAAGGRLWATSRPGEGSTFHITVPQEGAG